MAITIPKSPPARAALGRDGQPNGRASPITWTEAELVYMCRKYPELLATEDPRRRLDLLRTAQGMLPKHRRRHYNSLYISTVNSPQYTLSILDKARKAIALMPPDPEPTPKKAKGGVKGASLTKWSHVELASLALHGPIREALQDPDHPPPNHRLLDMIVEAQSKLFDSMRWRKRLAIQSSMYGPKNLVQRLRKIVDDHAPAEVDRVLSDEEAGPLLNGHHERDWTGPGAAAAHEEVMQEVPPTPPQPPSPVAPTPGANDAIASGLTALFGMLKTAIHEGLRDGLREGLAHLQMPTPPVHVPKAARAPSASEIAAKVDQQVRSTIMDVLGGPSAPAAPAAPVAVQPVEPEEPEEPQPVIPEHEAQFAQHDDSIGADFERQRKPRVDVVGLLNGQKQIVIRECGDRFKLRFIGSDEAAHAVYSAPTAIVCQKFIKGNIVERATKQGASVITVNGAASAVVERLNGMAA
jgi:hypothetical protein